MNRQVQCVICKKMVDGNKAYRSWKRWWFCTDHCYGVFQKIGRKLLGWDKKEPMFRQKDKK